jgi:hypothetical protein
VGDDGPKAEDKPAAKRARVGENVSEAQDDEVGPSAAPGPGPSTNQDDGSEKSDSDDDDEDGGAADSDIDDESTFPITHEITLKDHTKACLSIPHVPSVY